MSSSAVPTNMIMPMRLMTLYAKSSSSLSSSQQQTSQLSETQVYSTFLQTNMIGRLQNISGPCRTCGGVKP